MDGKDKYQILDARISRLYNTLYDQLENLQKEVVEFNVKVARKYENRFALMDFHMSSSDMLCELNSYVETLTASPYIGKYEDLYRIVLRMLITLSKVRETEAKIGGLKDFAKQLDQQIAEEVA